MRALSSDGAGFVRFIPYGVSVAAGLYMDTVFAFTLAAHVKYVATICRRRVRPAFFPFAFAAIAALAVFASWIAVLARGRAAITNNSYLGAALSTKIFALKWFFNAGATFYDLDYERHATVVLLVPIFAIVIAGVVALVRNAARRALLFLAFWGLRAP